MPFKDLSLNRLAKSINLQGRADIRDIAFLAQSLISQGEKIETISSLVSACINITIRVVESNKFINKFETAEDALLYLESRKIMNLVSAGKNQKRIVGRALSVESYNTSKAESTAQEKRDDMLTRMVQATANTYNHETQDKLLKEHAKNLQSEQVNSVNYNVETQDNLLQEHIKNLQLEQARKDSE